MSLNRTTCTWNRVTPDLACEPKLAPRPSHPSARRKASQKPSSCLKTSCIFCINCFSPTLPTCAACLKHYTPFPVTFGFIPLDIRTSTFLPSV
ncbi:hypothetical protein DL89DRAFT_268203 [Linderina pennispora]|uniref:Uncharacterized protein n=1 Tax=Linderina pennispora TaxID=61395 RepID=A0A1Y1W6L2_9FUNG|nr:uncharacterized protein DL89DRAFT_268203 [Linderina pennispora]ORX69183.1 hypothetical protein DL89DRAFT_268203 [Linderina pennispora]